MEEVNKSWRYTAHLDAIMAIQLGIFPAQQPCSYLDYRVMICSGGSLY